MNWKKIINLLPKTKMGKAIELLYFKNDFMYAVNPYIGLRANTPKQYHGKMLKGFLHKTDIEKYLVDVKNASHGLAEIIPMPELKSSILTFEEEYPDFDKLVDSSLNADTVSVKLDVRYLITLLQAMTNSDNKYDTIVINVPKDQDNTKPVIITSSIGTGLIMQRSR